MQKKLNYIILIIAIVALENGIEAGNLEEAFKVVAKYLHGLNDVTNLDQAVYLAKSWNTAVTALGDGKSIKEIKELNAISSADWEKIHSARNILRNLLDQLGTAGVPAILKDNIDEKNKQILDNIFVRMTEWADENSNQLATTTLNGLNSTQLSSQYARIFPILAETDNKLHRQLFIFTYFLPKNILKRNEFGEFKSHNRLQEKFDNMLKQTFPDYDQWREKYSKINFPQIIETISKSIDNSKDNLVEPSKEILNLLLHMCIDERGNYLMNFQMVVKLLGKYDETYKKTKSGDETFQLVMKVYNHIFRRIFNLPKSKATN